MVEFNQSLIDFGDPDSIANKCAQIISDIVTKKNITCDTYSRNAAKNQDCFECRVYMD